MPLPTAQPFNANEKKSAPAITQYPEKKNAQADENNPKENAEKNSLKKSAKTYADIEYKPPISRTEIVIVLSFIRGKTDTI